MKLTHRQIAQVVVQDHNVPPTTDSSSKAAGSLVPRLYPRTQTKALPSYSDQGFTLVLRPIGLSTRVKPGNEWSEYEGKAWERVV